MGQTERLRGKGQSSFSVVIRGSPDAGGIRGALCDTGFPGMAGVSVPIGVWSRREELCARREEPVLRRSPCRPLCKLVGSEGLPETPVWGVCLDLVRFMIGREICVGRTVHGKGEICS